MTGTPGDPIDGRVAAIGGTWHLILADQTIGSAPGATPASNGTTRSDWNDAPPPSPKYYAQATLSLQNNLVRADALNGLTIYADGTGNFGPIIYYDDTDTTIKLNNSLGTTIAQISYNIAINRDGDAQLLIAYDPGTNQLTAYLNGIQIAAVADIGTLPPAGVQILGYNAVAATNPPLISNITATTDDPPPPTITPFLWDTLVDTFGTNLSAHTPPIGGAWTAELGAPEYTFIDGGPINIPGSGNNRYTSAATPPTADYTVEAWLTGDAGYSDTTSILARYDGTSAYALVADLAGVLKLTKRVAGVDTNLDTGTFTMPVLDTPPVTIAIRCSGTLIEGLVDGTVVLSATDATLTLPGVVGIAGTRTVGQPVHVQTILAY